MDETPNGLDILLEKIDGLYVQIDAYPKSKRLFRELYHTVVSSLNFLSEKTTEGWVRRTTTGILGDSYHIDFTRGIIFNELAIEPSDIKENGRKKFIILERKCYKREPCGVEIYVYDPSTDLEKMVDRFYIDTWE